MTVAAPGLFGVAATVSTALRGCDGWGTERVGARAAFAPPFVGVRLRQHGADDR